MTLGAGVLVVMLVMLIAGSALLGAVALVALYLIEQRRGPAAPSLLAALRRHGLVVSLTAWVCAGQPLLSVAPMTVRALLPDVSDYGGVPDLSVAMVLFLAAVVALPCLMSLGIFAVGERILPRPAGAVRQAALVPRPGRSAAPRWLRRLGWSWSTALAAALALVVLFEPGGELVRVVERAVRPTSTGIEVLRASWPGGQTAVIAGLAAAVVLAASAAVQRQIARRPALLPDVDADDAARQLTAHRALRLPQLTLGLLLGGVLAGAGLSLQAVELQVAGVACLGLGAAVTLTALVATCLPATPLPVPFEAVAPAPGPRS